MCLALCLQSPAENCFRGKGGTKTMRFPEGGANTCPKGVVAYLGDVWVPFVMSQRVTDCVVQAVGGLYHHSGHNK